MFAFAVLNEIVITSERNEKLETPKKHSIFVSFSFGRRDGIHMWKKVIKFKKIHIKE